MLRRFILLAVLLLPAHLWAGTVEIEAEKMTVLHQNSQVIFTGHVHLQRDDFELFSDRLVAYYTEHDLQRAEAFGHIKLHQGDVTGTADKAILDQQQNTLTLTGNAVLQQQGSRIEGEQIVHDMKHEKTIVLPAKDGRTHMTIESDDSGNAALPGIGQ